MNQEANVWAWSIRILSMQQVCLLKVITQPQKIWRYLLNHIIHDSSKYYPIYSEKEFTFNGIKQGNRNALLYTDPSVDGLKTGHTDEAGYCLTTSSKRGPMRLISVIFGAPSMNERASQTRSL